MCSIEDLHGSLGVERIINASDTYTGIGGSLMSEETMRAMRQGGESFVDIQVLNEKVSMKIAEITNNESAFISSGAAACVILSSAACMAIGSGNEIDAFPSTSGYKKTEIIVFKSQVECEVLPYWHLIELSGATLVKVEDSVESFKKAITDKTAAAFFFAGSVYEWTTPALEDVIEVAKEYGIPFIVDAAAQLPPKSNTYYYTKTLGADAVIFSGGKFIKGPQTTGIILGKKCITDVCKNLASPNVKIGRPFKAGKEELFGIYHAFISYMNADEEETFANLERMLHQTAAMLEDSTLYTKKHEKTGRLGQYIPMLYLQFTKKGLADACYTYMRSSPEPIDIGIFLEGDPSKKEETVFINAINLHADDIEKIAKKFNCFLRSVL